MSKSFKPEVTTDGETFAGNALRFATEAEAEAYVSDLYCRWTSVQATRVIPSADPVTAKWQDGRTIHLSDKGGVHV